MALGPCLLVLFAIQCLAGNVLISVKAWLANNRIVPRPGGPVIVYQNTSSLAAPSSSIAAEPEAIVPGDKGQFVSVVGDSTIGAVQGTAAATPSDFTPFPLQKGNPTGLSPSLVTAPPPLGTGSTINVGSASLLVTSNGSCGSCTVNVQNADLFFWYPQTYQWEPYKYTQLAAGNGSVSFTSVPNPTPFTLDVSGIGAAALETFFFTPPSSTTTYTPLVDTTGPSMYTTQTGVVVQTAAIPSETVAPEFTA